jgi:hypothetical protein
MQIEQAKKRRVSRETGAEVKRDLLGRSEAISADKSRRSRKRFNASSVESAPRDRE